MSNSPILDAQNNQQASMSNKNVPNKSIEDGNNNSNKRVSKPVKWNRLDVETKASSSSYAQQQSTSRRRSPPRGGSRRDDRDYYREDRPARRSSNRSNVPPTNPRGPPRVNSTTVTNNSNNIGSIKSTTATSRQQGQGTGSTTRRENTGSIVPPSNHITRSNRPSYLESKTPGLNGNPILKPEFAGQLPYDAKKPKPLLGRPIIIEAATTIPVLPNVWTNGATYYFNNPPPFTIDAIENIRESIKKQM